MLNFEMRPKESKGVLFWPFHVLGKLESKQLSTECGNILPSMIHQPNQNGVIKKGKNIWDQKYI